MFHKISRSEPERWFDLLFPPLSMLHYAQKIAEFYLKYETDDLIFNDIGQLVFLRPPINLEHQIINLIFSAPEKVFDILAKIDPEKEQNIFQHLFDYADLATWFLRITKPMETKIYRFVFSKIVHDYLELIDWNVCITGIEDLKIYKLGMFEGFTTMSQLVRCVFPEMHIEKGIPPVSSLGGLSYLNILECMNKEDRSDDWEFDHG